jgi:tetratricopeptide (TPR) repeat protein
MSFAPSGGMSLGTDSAPISQLLLSAEALFNRGRVDDAAAIYAQVVATSCGGEAEAEAEYALGVIALGREKFGDSATHLMAALKLNPRHADAMFYGARLQVMQGQQQDAITTLTEVLRIDPTHGSARAELTGLRSLLDGRTPIAAEPLGVGSSQQPNDYGQWTYFITRPPAGQEVLASELRAALDGLQGSMKPTATGVLGFFLSQVVSLKGIFGLGFLLFFLLVSSFIGGIALLMFGMIDNVTFASMTPSPYAAMLITLVAVLVAVLVAWLVWSYCATYAHANRYSFSPDGRGRVEAGVFSRRRLIVDVARVREVMISSRLFQTWSNEGNLVLEMVDREEITLIGCGTFPDLERWQAKIQNLAALLKRVPTGGLQY